ncbi:DNA polymerase III subunit epsilon [Candidatus Enterovibrio altilux]|uniref:DNA polymerase III subunit epsilon n=1 Tax=Candidatus Enterovibrio altilux TaxID=1927128 RepID=UPI000BBC760E|nr:DNA polymerase III subunit epsilon [Candidatus Enterovibrio luxaltus]
MNANYNKIIVLDTETTGINREGGPVNVGHKIIEIGAVEIVNRKLTGNYFHVYIKPDRKIDLKAIAVHGITDIFLVDKPKYSVIHKEFLEFIKGTELVAHNAPFDVSFIDGEFQALDPKIGKIEDYCRITDTLAMAKQIFPGQKNNLDILCERYGIDNSHRTMHGALLDAKILADVYLLMTGGQTTLAFSGTDKNEQDGGEIRRVEIGTKGLKIIHASADELIEHNSQLDIIEKKGSCLWGNGR